MQDIRLHGRIGRALALLGMVEQLRVQGMDAADIGLLAILASHTDEMGECYPSQSTLAKQVSRERAWVNRRLSALSQTEIGSMKALEKLRRSLRKGGETSCLYRIPHMNLKLISTNNADSITNTPCGEQSHKQEQSHYQETLPQSAREYENKPRVEESDTAAWTPTTKDIAFATAKRPDLSHEDLILLSKKLLAQHGKHLPPAKTSLIFRRWVLTERTVHHAYDQDHCYENRRYSSGPTGKQRFDRSANRDKALAALNLLAG
jgi:hypothetical protein